MYKGKPRGMTGKKHSKESILKIRLAHLGKKQSKKTIEKRVKSRSWYKPTEEHKKKIGLSNKGKKRKPFSDQVRKNMSEGCKRNGVGKWMKGRTPSEETRKKLRENNARYWLGKKRSIEDRKKMSLGLVGKIPWNKGKTGLQVAWNKGTNGLVKANSGSFKKGQKLSSETRKKISKANKGRTAWALGKKFINRKSPPSFSIEHRKNISKMAKGRKVTEETKKKLSIYHINNPNKKFKDTSIELKIEAELIKRKIKYKKQFPLCNVAIVDFYLPKLKTVIQTDGCYWHGCLEHFPLYTKNKGRDKYQNKVLLSKGYKLFRFWEHEINKSPEECVDTVLK